LQKDYSIYQFLLYVFSQEKEKTYPNIQTVYKISFLIITILLELHPYNANTFRYYKRAYFRYKIWDTKPVKINYRTVRLSY